MEYSYHSEKAPNPYVFTPDVNEAEILEAAFIEKSVLREREGFTDVYGITAMAVNGDIEGGQPICLPDPNYILEALEEFVANTDVQSKEIADAPYPPAYLNRDVFRRRKLGSLAAKLAQEVRQKIFTDDDADASESIVNQFRKQLDDFKGTE